MQLVQEVEGVGGHVTDVLGLVAEFDHSFLDTSKRPLVGRNRPRVEEWVLPFSAALVQG